MAPVQAILSVSDLANFRTSLRVVAEAQHTGPARALLSQQVAGMRTKEAHRRQ
jgi:hypothetical protein